MKMNKDKLFFKLFADCVPVNGVIESIICDLNNESYFAIPNLLFQVLDINSKHNYTVEELKKHFNGEFSNGIDAYFKLFENKKIGFFTSSPEIFQEIALSFYSPCAISNSIIEISENSKFKLNEVLIQLEELGCIAVEIRYKTNYQIYEIESTLKLFNESRIRCFNLLLKYHNDITYENVKQLTSNIKRISKVIVHSCDNNNSLSNKENIRISFIEKELLEEDFAHEIKFTTNIAAFSEGYNFNLGLNKKVCIDEYGYIKNYISHRKSFGNIEDLLIKDAVKDESYKQIWSISNNKIEKCMFCQYRYICFNTSDIELNNGKYYRINDCMFNPFENKWSKTTNNRIL